METIIRRALDEGRSVLFEHELLDLLQALGLPVPEHTFISRDALESSPGTGELDGKRAVLKVVSERILHKSDVGGVVFVERASAESVQQAGWQMLAALPADLAATVHGFVLEEALGYEPGLGRELFIGRKTSADFGPVYTMGFGGTYIEAMSAATRQDQSTILVKPGLTSSGQLKRKLEGALFFGWTGGTVRGVRGSTTPEALEADLKRWVDALEKICVAVEAAGAGVEEVELNPLVWDGAWKPVDALLRLGPAPQPEAWQEDFPLGNLKRALAPKSIALMGVSTKMNVGRIILRCMLEGGYPAEQVRIIREDTDAIDGVTCVETLAALDKPVDLLVIAVAAGQVPAVLAEVFAQRRARAVLLIPGGMGETEGGKAIEAQVLDLLAEHAGPDRPVLIGNNSLGLVSRPSRFDSLFIPQEKLPRNLEGRRNVALISQSGAFIITGMTKLDFLAPDFQLSVGNQIDARLSHFVEALSDEEQISTYALYIEGFKRGDGGRLAPLVRDLVAAGKDVVVYKAGRSGLGQSATMGHTASVAGDFRVFRDVMQEAGALVAGSIQEFWDLVKISSILHDRTFTGRRVALMSNAGYESVAMADKHAGEGYCLEPATFGPATRDRITAALAEARIDKLVNVQNPLDLTPMANDAVHESCMRAILDDPGVDAAVFGNVPLTSMVQSLPRGLSERDVFDAPQGYANRAIQVFRDTSKPFAVVIDAGRHYDDMIYYLQDGGVPVFRSADRATAILGRYIASRARG